MGEYCRVLILDDEFIMRQGMKHMMDWEKEGFRIVGEAGTGEEGLALVEELKPHIVLVDIVMPVMDGIEFSAILGKKHPEIQMIILSSYDKFEYVKTTLLNGASDYILKPMLNPDNLLETLRRAVERIPGFELKKDGNVSVSGQLGRFITGFAERLDEAAFAETFPHTLYRLLGINLKECCAGRSEDYFTVKKRIEDYFKEQERYCAISVFLQEEMLCIVLNYRMRDDEELREEAEMAAEKIRRIHPAAFLVFSRKFTGIQEIRRYYEEDIVPETGNGFYYPDTCLLVVGEKKEKKVLKRFEFETYTGYLSMKEYEKALDFFHKYIDYLCGEKEEPEKMKNLVRNLLYYYLMEAERVIGREKAEGLKEMYFRQIENAQWIDRFEKVTACMFAELKEMLDRTKGAEDDRIREIKAYVEEHYTEALELSVLAERLNLSYSYLSTYFNQTAKEGFNEYLNKIRIRHARELLTSSSLAVSRIGEMVGYTEHSYFCRVFKKLTSETPSEYRKKVKRG